MSNSASCEIERHMSKELLAVLEYGLQDQPRMPVASVLQLSREQLLSTKNPMRLEYRIRGRQPLVLDWSTQNHTHSHSCF